MDLSKEEIINSLRTFKSHRDALLHEDTDAFDHNLERFLSVCKTDPLVRKVLSAVEGKYEVDIERWWKDLIEGNGKIFLPAEPDHELLFRYHILQSVAENEIHLHEFGYARGKSEDSESTKLFRSLIARPFAEEITHRIAKIADLVTPEARILQAVPVSRIPGQHEARIFLSHKSSDKPIVYRYHKALKQLGFDPWIDEADMVAGTNLERGIYQGFEESCAAVFFITENFRDEQYLATEIDYAIRQKRKKEDKFAIITLRHSSTAKIPGLLETYIFRDVTNDLEGFYEVLRALPIELGQTRWKESAINQ